MIGPELSGGKVNLRQVGDDDLPRRVEWLNDPETVRLFTGSTPQRVYEIVDAERWRLSLEADPAALLWAVETKRGRHIGDVDLHGIDRYGKTARLTVLLGDKEFWNKGCGTDVVSTLLCYAFSELGLESVGLKVYDFNRRAVRCYEKCGFVMIGEPGGNIGKGAGPGEIHMTATKHHFFRAEERNAGTIHA